jgi:hypothetical protein
LTASRAPALLYISKFGDEMRIHSFAAAGNTAARKSIACFTFL